MTTPITQGHPNAARSIPVETRPAPGSASAAPPAAAKLPVATPSLARAVPVSSFSGGQALPPALLSNAAPGGPLLGSVRDPIAGVHLNAGQPPRSSELPGRFQIGGLQSLPGQPFHGEIRVGDALLGTITGSTDQLAYSAPNGEVQMIAERQPRFGFGSTLHVQDAEGALIGTIETSWNNRTSILAPDGSEIARLVPNPLRSGFEVRAGGEDVGTVSERFLHGGWSVDLKEDNGIDPRLVAFLPSFKLAKADENGKAAMIANQVQSALMTPYWMNPGYHSPLGLPLGPGNPAYFGPGDPSFDMLMQPPMPMPGMLF